MREDATNLMSTKAIGVLRRKLIASGTSRDLAESCDYKVTRTSKYGVEILFSKGLAAVAKFKVNAREGDLKRVI